MSCWFKVDPWHRLVGRVLLPTDAFSCYEQPGYPTAPSPPPHPPGGPRVTPALCAAVKFPTLYQQRGEDGDLEAGSLRWRSPEELTLSQPWLDMFLLLHLMRSGDGGRAPAVSGPRPEGERGGAEAPQMGTRKCGKSTKRTMWGGWGLAPAFAHHAIPLPGHLSVQSTVSTL